MRISGSTPSRAPSEDADLDRIDRQLLVRLQQDGRTPIARLAREVSLTVTPTLERVRRLERRGYIEGYFARLDAAKLGLGLLAYVEVSLDRTTPDAFERFKQAMLAHDEVMECHMVAGGFDYLLRCACATWTATGASSVIASPRCAACNRRIPISSWRK
jgi:Lrp/AsnC family transcriptional regulator, leucine-responsive regulatory protein